MSRPSLTPSDIKRALTQSIVGISAARCICSLLTQNPLSLPNLTHSITRALNGMYAKYYPSRAFSCQRHCYTTLTLKVISLINAEAKPNPF